MFKSTLFIAVKCCQCATMQVKQQKKSSNKWNCAVCNQKQSVTKIFAQGFQAKDIRNVVQSFNMSRKFEDDQLQHEAPSLGHFVEHNQGVLEIEENSKGKRRTDWREYIDDDNDVEPAYLRSKLVEKEMVDEAKVVTELSEDLMFKKPRLKGKFGSAKDESYKPNFANRGGSTKEIKETQSSSLNVAAMRDGCILDDSDAIRDASRRHGEQQQVQNKVTGASKQYQYAGKNHFREEIGGRSELQKQQQQQQTNKRVAIMKASGSKWSKYVAEDDDDNGGRDKEVRAPAFADDFSVMCGYKPENDDVDQLIEEEIHPDFM